MKIKYILLFIMISVGNIYSDGLLLRNLFLPSTNKVSNFQPTLENTMYVLGPIEEVKVYSSEFYDGGKTKTLYLYNEEERLIEMTSFSYETGFSSTIYVYDDKKLISSFRLVNDESKENTTRITYGVEENGDIVQYVYNTDKKEIKKNHYDLGSNLIKLTYNMGSTPITTEISYNLDLVYDVHLIYHYSKSSTMTGEDRHQRKNFKYNDLGQLVSFTDVILEYSENIPFTEYHVESFNVSTEYEYDENLLISAEKTLHKNDGISIINYQFKNIDEYGNWTEMSVFYEDGKIIEYRRELLYREN